jgi:hypothetical protein
MTDQKPNFASLTSGLLARKGAARPAMRPQAIDHNTASLEDLGWNDMGDDAGPYNDLPAHVPSSISALTPAPRNPSPDTETEADVPPPPVIEQRKAIEAHFGEVPELEDPIAREIVQPEAEAFEPDYQPEPVQPERRADVVSLPPRQPDLSLGRGKAAFTLRLDGDRHLKLRLATAVQNRSAQRIVIEALDAYLNALPELDTLAQQVPARQGKRS